MIGLSPRSTQWLMAGGGEWVDILGPSEKRRGRGIACELIVFQFLKNVFGL